MVVWWWSTVVFKAGPEGGLERQKRKRKKRRRKKKKNGLPQLQRLGVGQQAMVDCTCGHWAPPSPVAHVPARKENCLRTEGERERERESGHYHTHTHTPHICSHCVMYGRHLLFCCSKGQY